ncbi:uncharacterized protein LOC135336225 isoform X3 [Halichondria panicea]|uniref:uncharacterized protein LOC135336225 isoform X3 n=1 Tax=Halichondria panicea TaxID=6063 RepID=UPI00312B2F2B
MARSIFALTAVVLALSFSAQAQAQDVGSMFCDYGLYMCPDMYGSSNVSCINYTLVCDGTVHCYGGRDESLCGNCSSGYIQCPNTDTCISNTQACDGVVDCTLDDADETVRACGCVNDNQVPVCGRSMNDTTRYCLNETLVCDGISHCMYGEDESSQYCGQECEGDLLSCFDNGTCYEVYEMCNGAFECPNGFDEGNCSDSAADRFCPYATYNCPNLDGNGGRTCINYTRVCDGTNDCYNGTDEAFCGDCPMDSIACASNSSICVENTRTCDGIQDCPDGCDESITACGCSDSAQIPVCRDGNGNPYCVNRTALCDGMSDCMNGEDEQFPYCPTATTPPPTTNPPVSCPTGYVPCATFSNSGPPCINNSLVCNSFSDCADQSDEFYCNGCPTGELMCQGLNFTQCVANTYLCDGDNNCPNGFDESICTTDNIMPTGTPTGTPTFACPTGYVACATFSNSGSPCINNSLVCNSYIDCADQSDEFYCNDCPTDELMCQGLNFTQCVPNTYLCDGNNNCPNGFDESICTIDITTPTGMPTGPPIGGPCPNGSLPCGFNFSNCWVPEQACDGVNDCGDELAYDEIPGFVELSGESCITDGGSGSGFLGGTNDLVIGLLAPPFFDGLIPFSEFGGSFSFCIVRGGVSSSDEFNVTVTTTDVNAVAGYDYEDATQTLYFGSQDSIMCINVTIIEDDLIESTENFTISLSVSADVNYTFIGPTEATVVILDFNGIGFDLVTSNVTESDNATFELCITLTDIRGGLERNVTLEIRQIDFGLPTGAQNGVDFTITNPFITIPRTAENGTKMCFTFANVINDERIEDTERAIFFLTSNNFADVSRDTSFTIEIIDNDFVQFELLNATEVQVEEDRSISLCLAPVGNVSAYYDRLLPYITVIFNVTSETADNGDYYTGSVYQLFDVRSSDIVCVMIITREDSQIENTETLRVTAIISDPDVVVGPSQVRVYILDRDSAEFESSSFMPHIAMREADWYLGAPPRSFCFAPTPLTRVFLQRDVTLTFTPSSLGAMRGEDFMINDTEVTFYHQGDMMEVCLELVIVNDLFIEDLERFTIDVVPNNPYDRILGNNRTEISIEDNDFAEFVSPFNAMIAMRESDWFPEKEPRSFCLVPTNRTRDYLRRSVAVTFTPSTLGAMMGEDFMLYGTMQTFYQDNTSVCLQLRIINDRRIEYTESFAIEISLDNPDDSIVGVNRTEISIADDDFVVIELELVANDGYVSEGVDNFNVSEGDTFNVNLVLVDVMDGLETDVEVNVTVGVNSLVVRRHVEVYASSNEFSPFGVQILTIPSSSMNGSVVSLTVTVVDDEIVENDEGLRISVNPGNQYQVTNEQAGTVVLTIMDNDGVSLFLSTNEIMSLEGGEISVAVYVDMESPVRNRDVQVNVTIDYNNADANDTGNFSQVLVFTPDINVITVTIPVVADNIVGSDKMFTVNFNPTNSLDTFIDGSNSVSVTIIESANLTLTQRNMMGMEGDVVEVCVAHAHTLEDSVSVLLTLITGTAEEADFAFYATMERSYTVTFNNITSNQICVNVSLIDDDIAENSESFVVVLTAIDTDDTIGINSTNITIADNDGVMFSSPDVVATETNDDQNVLVCVIMTPPAGGLDRNAAVSDGESGVTLTFSPTNVEQTQCVNVTVFGDRIVESNETVNVTFHIQYPLDSMNGSLYFSANIIIVDDDGATVSFTIPSQDANEDAGNVSVCVTLVDVDGGLNRTVPYTITSDMRNIWNDEFPGNSSAGQEKCITVYIEEDQIVEDPEIRVFTLAVVNGNDLLGDIVTHNVTEIDNDGVSITLMPIGEVMENQTVDIEFFVEGILDKDITVTVYIEEDTNDTMIIDGDLIVSDNGTYTVVLVVIGDSIIENPETYTVQIRSDNTFDEIGPAQDFTIIDQDGATIQLDLISDITETDEDVNITVSFSVMGVFERPSTVTVGLVPVDTNDVRIVNNVITVAESGGYTVTMVIVGDVLIENTEDFRLMFVSDNDNDVFYQGLGPEMIEDGNLSFSVMDNDGAIFTLATISDVTETDVDITIPVNFTVTGLFERNSTVTVRLALDTNDVIIANGEVTVSVAGDYYVELVVVGDEIVESDETFTVEIAVSNPLDTTPGPTQTFTVSDDDGAIVLLETTMVDLAKGDAVRNTTQVCLSVTSDLGLLERNVTISTSVDESGLTVDSELAITMETGRVCFEVSVIDDGEVLNSVLSFQITFSLRWPVDNFEQFFITTIYVTPLVTDVNYTPFIDLAEDDGVKLQRLTNTDDGCSSLIYINSGLPYGSKSETSLRVCANGAISIGTEHFNFFSPSRFPSSSSQISSSNVLAPYWNDHDLRGDGSSINYKVYTREQGSRVSDAKLDAISRLISNKEELSFSGIWMLVAEWNGAPAYPFNTDKPPRNTYQAVVVTDGTQTFAVYTYNCEQLEWESGQGSSVYSVIGYNINDGNSLFSSVNPFMNHPLSRSKGVRSVACMNNPLRVEWSNLVYLVGNDTGAGQLARANCINRANKDQSSFQAKSFNSQPCPCSFAQAGRDNRYRFARNTLFFITRDTSFFDNFCYVQRFRSTNGVQLCCYSRQSGALLGDRTSGSDASSSSLLRFNPFSQQSDYLEFDYNFQESCCKNSDMCQEYTRLRPSHDCSSYRPQRRGWFWGDPHVTTLDGDVFTFNGWGEYSLLEFTTDTTAFTFQGRTGNVSDSERSATKLIAFAFGVSTEMRVQVDVNGDTGLTVLFNGDDISANVSNTNDSFTIDQLSVSRESENSLTTSFENGIGVTITASFEMLSFVLSMPEEFQNVTRGLMGNYNGDPTDDIVFRNGDMLSGNVSDRMIHDFGQSWEISAQDSFFTYPEGMSAADYSFPNHEPIFADEAADSVPQDVLDACGDNQECIFDAIQTGNLEIGMETLTTNNGNIDDQNQASNSPPLITGPNMLRLDVGVMAILRFNVSDDKNMFNVTVVGGLPENSQLTPTVMDGYTDYEFDWTLSTVESARSIMFEARDELNASAVLNVQVQTCACMNSSDCTIEGIADTTASSIVLNCECSEAWMGEFCEEDVDGCMEFMCFDDVACTDVPAPGVGAACGMCPDGYVGDGEKCEDINECTNGTHGCSQICNNVQGSFECLCNEGYRLANATYCEDINECDMLNGRCHQNCTNNDGGHSCSCFEGYELSNDNLTCTVLPTFVCPVNNTCSQNCVSLLGVETCSCNQGYQLATNNQTCSDVDECLEGPCGQGCNNTDGGFVCYCRDGYTLQPDETTCMDINECLVSAMSGVTLCTSPMFCVNMPGDAGKYSCQCPEGTIQAGNTCVMPTTPPPTIVVPTGTVPSAFRDNAVVITLDGRTAEEFDETQRQMFRVSTANAINAYCRENPCTFSRKRQAATVTADDVIIENVRDNNAGHLTFDMYVQSGGSAALPASAVQEAIEENPNFFPGQMVMVEPLEAPPTTMLPIPVGLSTAEIIGIAVGCAVGGILLIVLIVVLIVCIIRYRHKHQKSVNFSYGIEYDNPVADNDDDIEPANTRPMNGVEITVAAPDIYVNPGDLSEQAEEEPKAKEAAVTDEIAERDEGASNSDRSMQSLILKFGDDDDNASQHSTEKEELTSL